MSGRGLVIMSLCALLALLPSCASNSPSSPSDEQDLEISVGPGITPYFTWTPAGQQFFWLLVETTMSGHDMWHLQGDGNTIASGVEYAVAPPGVTEVADAETLVVGTEYRVILFTSTATDTSMAAYKEFTP